MKRHRFEESLAQIVKEDPRYPIDAYLFLRHALDYTIRMLNKPENGPGRHVSGQELLDGIRQCALQEFGPIARTVLRTWGINRTEDFGDMVFNLVSHGLLGKTEKDSKADFAGGYDFHAAFTAPFLPSGAAPARKTGPARRHPQPKP
jgi:uncharacterized repeat protein (TIGR04138 family)